MTNLHRQYAVPLTVLLGLCSCGARVSYDAVKGDNPDPANSLRFSLQQPTITLQQAAKTGGGTPVLTCPAKTTSATFQQCFNTVALPVVASVAVDDHGSYLAKPEATFLSKIVGATTLTGTTVGQSPVLYSKVNFNYTDNVPNIIGGAGTGAVTGATIGGPLGLAIGAGVGVIVSVGAAELPAHQEAVPYSPPAWVRDYVCQTDQRALSWSSLSTTPALNLPVVIKPTNLPTPYETGTLKTDTTKGCWHLVPNPQLGTGSLTGTYTPRAAVTGDGWLYRVVFDAPIPKDNKNIISTSSVLPTGIVDTQFPYSYCRPDASLQITWWGQLQNADSRNIDAIAYSYRLGDMADPDYVQLANIPYSGSISFNPVCGVSTNGSGPDVNAIWSAINTQTQGILKVQSEGSQGK